MVLTVLIFYYNYIFSSKIYFLADWSLIELSIYISTAYHGVRTADGVTFIPDLCKVDNLAV